MTTSQSESKVDVLVIGAGPAGVFCAHALAKAGVDVRIVDQRPEKVAAGQADGIQPRTIEVFQSYGLAERLLNEGNQMHMAAFYNPSPSGGITRTGRAADVTAPTARYPFEVTLHQGAIEAIFLDAMKAFNVQVERETIPTALEISSDLSELKDPQAYPVKVTLKKPKDTTEIVHAKYVVGADGAHSWVRRALNIAMEGEQTDYIWGVVDSIPETDFPDIRNRCAIHSVNGSCMVIPREGDKVRLYVQLTDTTTVQGGRVDKAKWASEQIIEVVQKSMKPYTLTFPHPIDWWTIYIIGQRVASRFSVKERVFIVGDACHTHSPKAGQGMNASMNDSHNLAWKLTQVLRAWARPELLKTYEFERRKYAQDLIAFDKKFAAVFSGKARTEENQDGITHEQFLEVFQTFGGFTSGIGIHYAPSIITEMSYQSVATNLNVGQRIPPQVLLRAADSCPYELHDLLPSDVRFKILILAGDTKDNEQLNRLDVMAKKLLATSDEDGGDGVLRAFVPPGGGYQDIFDIITISATHKDLVDYTDVPALLRPHWSKVFIDDIEMQGVLGGQLYTSYGISKTDGAIVLVRPDGYVGMVAALEQVAEVGRYLEGILVRRA